MIYSLCYAVRSTAENRPEPMIPTKLLVREGMRSFIKRWVHYDPTMGWTLLAIGVLFFFAGAAFSGILFIPSTLFAIFAIAYFIVEDDDER